VQIAENRFLYLWEMCNADVKSIKNLLLMTHAPMDRNNDEG